MTTRGSFAVVCCLLAGAGSAQAAEPPPPNIAVLDVRPADPSLIDTAAKARDATEAALARFRVRVPAADPAVAAAHAPDKDKILAAGVEKARARAKEARALFDAQNPAAAEKKLREAADLFEANAGALSAPDDLVGAYVFLARIFFATQREVLIRDVFKRTVQLNPDLILDKAIYPAGMIRVYDEVKAEILSSPQGTLHIESTPGPAWVFLDARNRGVTPLDLQNIPPGVHALTVKRPGFAPFTRPLEVTSFRADRITAELTPDRHPFLEALLVAGGAERKDALGRPLVEYMDAVSAAAALDLVLVGQLARETGNKKFLTLSLAAWEPKSRTLSAVHVLRAPTGKPPDVEPLVEEVLLDAVGRGWIPPLSARRNVEFGGGALDPTAPIAVRASVVTGVPLASASRHFPEGPGAGLRVSAEWRLGSRLLAGVETGIEGVAQGGMRLSDSEGQPLESGAGSVTAIYDSIPLMATARWYFGVGKWAPYVAGGAGAHFDSLLWRETLPNDRLTSASGIGFGAFAGGGVDRALGPRSALVMEARLSLDQPGVGDARLSSRNAASRTVPVDPGTITSVRINAGYLRMF